MAEFEQFEKFPAPGIDPAPSYSQLVGRVEDLERQVGGLSDLVTKLLTHKHMIYHGGSTTPPFWMNL